MIDQRELFYLSPSLGIFVRDMGHIQLGLDSARAVIIPSPNAASLAQVLRSVQGGRALNPYLWQRALATAGMNMLDARGLFHDLVDYGIIQPERVGPRLVILGESPLAKSIRSMCLSRDVGVRSPLNWEDLSVYLSTMEDNTVVLVIDQLHNTPDIAQALHALPDTCSWVPLSIIDSRGIIGPLRIRGAGACPWCFELHRVEFDPRWSVLTKQLEDADISTDPQVIASVTARAAVIVDWLIGRPFPPGTKDSQAFRPGDIFDIDVFGTSVRKTIRLHPQCPECFAQTG